MGSLIEWLHNSVLYDWVWHVFVNGFCVSLTRPGILIFLLLVLCLRFGAGLGLPLLFWRPRDMPPTQPQGPSLWKRAIRRMRKKRALGAGDASGAPVSEPAPAAPISGRTRPNLVAQLFVGVGVGVLMWQVLLAGYVFEEFATNYTQDRAPFCENRENHPGEWHTGPPDFGGPDHAYPGRFRYDPQAVGSVWLYGAAVASGFAAFGLALVVAASAVFGAMRAYRRVRYPDWKPYSPAAPKERPHLWKQVVNRAVQLLTGIEPYRDPSDPTPIPYSPALPLGVLVGLFATSGLTSVWLHPPEALAPLVEKLSPAGRGEWAIRQGGYGEAADRQERIKSHVLAQERKNQVDPFSQMILAAVVKTTAGVTDATNPETPTEDTSRWKPKEWLAPYFPVYGAFFLNFGIIAVVSLLLMAIPLRARIFSPAVGIVFFLNLFLYVHVLFNYFYAFPADFVVLVGAVFVLLAGRGYKLGFANLKAYYDAPVPLPAVYADLAATAANATRPGSAPPPPPLAPNAIKPLDSRKLPYPSPEIGSGKRPLAIVCVSGGGSRAAAWTMKTLIEIERAFGNPVVFATEAGHAIPANAVPVAFPYHVRLVTGASGGMISAAQYVASLAAPDARVPSEPGDLAGVKRNGAGGRVRPTTPGAFPGDPLTRAQLFDGVCADFLTPIVHSLVTRDIPSLFLPFHYGLDRGQTIEEEWKLALHGQLDQTFGDLRAGEAAGWRPSLIFSPMLVEDGRQLLISNLDLFEVVQNRALILGEVPNRDGSHCSGVKGDLNPPDGDGRRLLSREGLEFFKVFPQAHDFRVSTAARMSASFPYVMPAVPLPTNPPRRVVDAGYADNYGVGAAASWLFNHLDWIKEHASGVVVIQIRDGASGASRRRECVFDAFPSVSEAGLQWATSPPEGLWNYRTASHAFRDDNLLHLLTGSFEQRDQHGKRLFDPGFFTTVSFELQQGNEVALNFTLTEGERQIILDAVNNTGFRDQLDALLQWWYGRL